MRGDSSSSCETSSARRGSPGRSTRSASSACGLRWIGCLGSSPTIWETARSMPKRRTTPQLDAVRDAVERTIQATLGSALDTRDRAQDLVRGAEASAEAVRERVKGAIEVGRPATYEDIRELRVELQSVVERLDAIERELSRPRPARAPAKKTRK